MKSSLENKKQLQQTEFGRHKNKIDQVIKELTEDTNNQHYQHMTEWKEKNEKCLKSLKSIEVGEIMGEFVMRGTEDSVEVLRLVGSCETILDSTNHLDCEFEVKPYLVSEKVFKNTTLLLKECFEGIEISSSILDSRMRHQLKRMLGSERLTFKLIPIPLTNTSSDQTSFRKEVVGKGPTLVVIRSTTNYIFGAYIHDTFNGSEEWRPGSRETFLFTFGNGSSQPLKLLHKGSGNGIYMGACGVHLGQNSNSSGNDLNVFCSPTGYCDPQVYTVVAPGYGPTTVTSTTMAGAREWTPSAVEVFNVTRIERVVGD